MDLTPNPMLIAALWLPFFVSFIALNALLVKPMREYLEGRHDSIVGERHQAARLQAEADERIKQLEASLAKGREQAAGVRGEHRARGQAREREVLAAARSAAEAELSVALQQIAAEAASARVGIADTARALSNDIAGQVLGRGLSA